jgi:hypothetical protein
MKVYVKTFINPLLALAFKEGVDFVGDPDYKAMNPKRDGEEWEVIVEHDIDDDAEITTAEAIPFKKYLTITNAVTPDKPNLKDWLEQQSKRISNMEPVNAQFAPETDAEIHQLNHLIIPEIINLPVKVPKTIVTSDESESTTPPSGWTSPSSPPSRFWQSGTSSLTVPTPINFDPSAMEPCGECLNCVSGSEDCIKIINAACLAVAPPRRKR